MLAITFSAARDAFLLDANLPCCPSARPGRSPTSTFSTSQSLVERFARSSTSTRGLRRHTARGANRDRPGHWVSGCRAHRECHQYARQPGGPPCLRWPPPPRRASRLHCLLRSSHRRLRPYNLDSLHARRPRAAPPRCSRAPRTPSRVGVETTTEPHGAQSSKVTK